MTFTGPVIQGKLIIQDMIPGNDEYMRVLTSYSDHNGKVKMMCLVMCFLKSITPHGIGQSCSHYHRAE